jgi:hypothetical protein
MNDSLMGKVGCVFFVLVLATTHALAQEPVRIKLNGKVSAEMSDLEGIYIINLKTEEATISEKGGYFLIQATVGDTLMFSAVQFKGIRVGLTQKHFEKELFFVKMEPIMNQLKEVIVRRYDNINAVALGIIPKGQKSYTPAERKYATASSGKMNPMGLDPMLNYFFGRSAMLKKELEVEKKEFYLKQLEDMFDVNHFVNNLKIPSEYVKGFEYYIVENEKFVNTLKSKNKTMTAFLMGELATKYNEIIACESK